MNPPQPQPQAEARTVNKPQAPAEETWSETLARVGRMRREYQESEQAKQAEADRLEAERGRIEREEFRQRHQAMLDSLPKPDPTWRGHPLDPISFTGDRSCVDAVLVFRHTDRGGLHEAVREALTALTEEVRRRALAALESSPWHARWRQLCRVERSLQRQASAGRLRIEVMQARRCDALLSQDGDAGDQLLMADAELQSERALQGPCESSLSSVVAAREEALAALQGLVADATRQALYGVLDAHGEAMQGAVAALLKSVIESHGEALRLLSVADAVRRSISTDHMQAGVEQGIRSLLTAPWPEEDWEEDDDDADLVPVACEVAEEANGEAQD
jgi:hypothetical protein